MGTDHNEDYIMNQEDHDRLIEMHTDIKWIKKTLTDHLRKHWWFVTVVITIVVGIVLTGNLFS